MNITKKQLIKIIQEELEAAAKEEAAPEAEAEAAPKMSSAAEKVDSRLEKATGLDAALDGVNTKERFMQVMSGMIKRASANMKNKNDVYTALVALANQFRQGAA